jgi:hypothetical protein
MNRYQEIEIDGKRMLSVEVLFGIRKGEEMLGVEGANLEVMGEDELARYLKELRRRLRQNVTHATATVQEQSEGIETPSQGQAQRRKMSRTTERHEQKKFNDTEVEGWIKRLEDALEQGNYPKKPVPVPGKPYITIVDFDKCVRQQISCYRAELDSQAQFDWNYPGILAARIKDLVDILDSVLTHQEIVESLSPDERMAFLERAAIMEYDGRLSREEAERQALEIVIRNRRED